MADVDLTVSLQAVAPKDIRRIQTQLAGLSQQVERGRVQRRTAATETTAAQQRESRGLARFQADYDKALRQRAQGSKTEVQQQREVEAAWRQRGKTQVNVNEAFKRAERAQQATTKETQRRLVSQYNREIRANQQRARQEQRTAERIQRINRNLFNARIRAQRVFIERSARQQYRANQQRARQEQRTAERIQRINRNLFNARIRAQRVFIERSARQQYRANQQLIRESERVAQRQQAIAARGFALAGGGLTGAVAGGAALGGAALLGGAAAVYGAARLTSAYVEQAETLQLLRTRLRILIPSQTEFADTFDQLYFRSQRSGVELESTAKLYERLRRAGDRFGASQEELLTVTTAVQQALVLSGATFNEVRNSLLQLAQGLSSNQLGGDELRTLRESAPRLVQVIADGLDIGIGELKAAGARGELTFQTVVGAIVSQAETLAGEMEQAGNTFTRGATRFGTSVQNLILISNEAGGITTGLGTALTSISEVLDHLTGRAENAEQSLSDVLNIPIVAGTFGGLLAGGKAGALAGSFLGPVGTFAGAAVGGIAGAVTGATVGGNIGAAEIEAAQQRQAEADRNLRFYEAQREALSAPVSSAENARLAAIQDRIDKTRELHQTINDLTEAERKNLQSSKSQIDASRQLDRVQLAQVQQARTTRAEVEQQQRGLALLIQQADIQAEATARGEEAAVTEQKLADARKAHDLAIVDILERTKQLSPLRAKEVRQEIALTAAISRSTQARQQQAEVDKDALRVAQESAQTDARIFNTTVRRLREAERDSRERSASIALREKEVEVLKQATREGLTQEQVQQRLTQTKQAYNQALLDQQRQSSIISQTEYEQLTRLNQLDNSYDQLTGGLQAARTATDGLHDSMREIIADFLDGSLSVDSFLNTLKRLANQQLGNVIERALFGGGQQAGGGGLAAGGGLIGSGFNYLNNLFTLPTGYLPPGAQGPPLPPGFTGGGGGGGFGFPSGGGFGGGFPGFAGGALGGYLGGKAFGPAGSILGGGAGLALGGGAAAAFSGGSFSAGASGALGLGSSGALAAAAGPAAIAIGAAIIGKLIFDLFNQPGRIQLEKESLQDFNNELFPEESFSTFNSKKVIARITGSPEEYQQAGRAVGVVVCDRIRRRRDAGHN